MKGRTKADGRPYSPRVVRKTVVQLYQVVNFALEMGYLDASPAPKMKRLSLPDEPAPRKVRLSGEQAKALIDAAPEPWRDFFVLALTTGARRSELFNATYVAIRWERKTREVLDEQPDGTASAVKSAAAVRSIPLPNGVVDMLRSRMLASGSRPEDLIFPNSLGGRMSYSNFYRRIWGPTAGRAGLKGLHLHDLRKAFATQLSKDGHTPAFIEDVMGHASYSTTMKYYTKATDEEEERARRELSEWIGREEPADERCAA